MFQRSEVDVQKNHADIHLYGQPNMIFFLDVTSLTLVLSLNNSHFDTHCQSGFSLKRTGHIVS